MWISCWTGITLPCSLHEEAEYVAAMAQGISEMAIYLGGTSGCWKSLSPWVRCGIPRTCWLNWENQPCPAVEALIEGLCFWEVAQTSSLLLPEHVWVCLLLGKGYKRAAAVGGWFSAGKTVQIRPSGVKNSPWEGGLSLQEMLHIWDPSAWGCSLH